RERAAFRLESRGLDLGFAYQGVNLDIAKSLAAQLGGELLIETGDSFSLAIFFPLPGGDKEKDSRNT
ncbi:MAG TPA: hypothetical protein VIO60_05245, partial [Rectinemataceae bacterium]